MSNTSITKKGRNQKHDIIEEMHSYNICIDTREIFLHGEIGDNSEDSGVDFKMSNKFIKNIRFLESSGDDPIIVHQHSIGGEWSDGMMIYDAIASCQCHIVFIMHGCAYSMGSIIPQAADLRIIMPNCTFMIHHTSSNLEATYKQLRSFAESEEKIKDKMLDIYSSVCINGHYFQKEQADQKKVREYIISKLNEKDDWYLFSREAVALGFADAVFGDDGYENLYNIRDSIING